MSFPPSHRRTRTPARGGFSLIELLIVIALMAGLAVMAVPALSTNGARKFTGDLGRITGLLEDARSAAVAQNTYVWVVFYPYDPSAFTPSDRSGAALYVASFVSSDGSNPFTWNQDAWSGSAVFPAGADEVTVDGGTTLKALFRGANFKQIALRTQDYFARGSGAEQIATLPASMPPTPLPPAGSPLFQIVARGIGDTPLRLPGPLPAGARTAQPLSVVLFTPGGAARVSDSPIDSIWIDFQRAQGAGAVDANNVAAIKINGLTGMVTLYRK